ncbi:hypothetical protein ADK43_12350 [Streptomyces rimosus subsp. rimosus]|nr:hypothetical protein ADK43_12350 [Streptomyces rimosus subsp. rimosus]
MLGVALAAGDLLALYPIWLDSVTGHCWALASESLALRTEARFYIVGARKARDGAPLRARLAQYWGSGWGDRTWRPWMLSSTGTCGQLPDGPITLD